MGTIIEQLSANPLHLVIAAILAILLVFFVFKKLFKLILFLAIALVVFIGYLHFTGREIPTNSDDIKQSLSEQVDKAKGAAGEMVDDAIKNAKDDLVDRVKGSE